MAEVSSDRWRKMRPPQKDKAVREALAKRMKENKPLSITPTYAGDTAALSGSAPAPLGEADNGPTWAGGRLP